MQRILVVDDDSAFRHALAAFLSGAGFEVEEADGYVKALDVIEDDRPLDLLIIDAMLPTVNGIAVARMARMKRLRLPIIHVTSFDIPGDEAIGPVFTKPVDLDAVLAEVKRLTETRDAAPSSTSEGR